MYSKFFVTPLLLHFRIMWLIIIMNSQDGSSEQFIGEWAEKRGIRDRLFIATKVFHQFFYDIDVDIGNDSLSIQTTLKRAKNRTKRFYSLGTTRNLSISLSSIPSRTCELTTSTCFMFIGGTGIPVLKKSWAHCTTSFSKAKFYIWYVFLLHLSVSFSAVTMCQHCREHLICLHGSSLKLINTRVIMLWRLLSSTKDRGTSWTVPWNEKFSRWPELKVIFSPA